MKKHLLLVAAILAATSSYAMDVDQKVYTQKGRFQVVGTENLISNGSFTDGNFAGWSVVSATEGMEMDGVFAYASASGDTPEGIVAVSNANTEGIKIALPELNDASKCYVVSVTVTSPEGLVPNFNFRNSNPDNLASVQLINIVGTAVDEVDENGNPVVTNYGEWVEILPNTNTYYFSVVGDGVARTFDLSLMGWDPQLRISNIEIKEAIQLGDNRPVESLLEYANALLAIKKVKVNSDEYEALAETVAAYDELGDDATIDDISGYLEGLNEVISEFEKNLVDDYLPGKADKLPLGSSKAEKLSNIGVWTGFGGGSGRLCTYVGALSEAGHYQKAATWGNGNGCIGFTTTMDLQPGSYVFSIDLRAAARENNKNSWNFNAGLSFAKELVYVKTSGAEDADAVASLENISDPNDVQKRTLSFDITEAGSYEIGVKTWAKEGYESLTYGSCVLMKDARLYGKPAAGEYNKAQLDYCADVIGQINAARTNIEKAKEYIADATLPWGKTALQEAIDTYEPVTEGYEAMDTASIIDTFDKDIYNVNEGLESKTQDEDLYRLLAGEVYINAAKGILAAVREFEAENAHITKLTDAITAAEASLESRVYALSSAKNDSKAVIEAAKGTDANLRADEYSDENVTLIEETIGQINDAIAALKDGVPSTAIVDLTGALTATMGEEGYTLTSEGGIGSMMIATNFSEDPNDGSTSHAIGRLVAEELQYANLLRVGNGEAKVALGEVDEDAIVQFTFDYYYGNLSGKYASFKVNTANTTVTGEGEEAVETTTTEMICGLNVSKYDGKADINTFNIDVNAELSAVGSSAESNEAIANPDKNKNSYTVTIDLLTNEMTCDIVSPKGTFSHPAVKEVEGLPTEFTVGSNYNNSDRRSFFGNLKVVAIKGGEATGITENVVKPINNGKIYNVAGVEVKSFVKGINIVNGKKFVK